MEFRKLIPLALAVLAALGLFISVRASGLGTVTVTNCSSDADLRAKLTELVTGVGGTLAFNCGTATITLTSQLPDVGNAVTIDGGGKIILSGNNSVRLLRVSSNGQLTLKNLVLDKGYAATFGGAILNEGYLALVNSTVQNSKSAADGGAIASFDHLELTDSVLANNSANYGGAIYADDLVSGARVKVTNSKFGTNLASANGGAISSSAPLEISGGEFIGNKAANGGAISARSMSGSSTVKGSTFKDNQATALNPNGNGGALLIENTSVEMQNIRLEHNTGNYGGGSFVSASGSLALTNSTLINNFVNIQGAGILNNGSATLTGVTLTQNQSNGYGSGIMNYGDLAMTNATLSGNKGQYSGGLDNYGGTASVTNATFYGNSAIDRAPAGILNNGTNPLLYLKNVIVANSLNGSVNCDVIHKVPTVSEFNLSSDNSCYFGLGRESVDVKLGALANNGGLTQTHLPQSGSPAIDGGTNGVCPATDQRGVSRPLGAACDVGAVEVDPTAPTATRTPTRTATKTPTITATRTPTKTPTRTATPTVASCANKPARPLLVKPGNTKRAAGPRVTLDWNDALCANTYKVILRLGSPDGITVQKKRGLTNSQFRTKALSLGKTYAWRVIAKNSIGKTKSDWWTFTVK